MLNWKSVLKVDAESRNQNMSVLLSFGLYFISAFCLDFVWILSAFLLGDAKAIGVYLHRQNNTCIREKVPVARSRARTQVRSVARL